MAAPSAGVAYSGKTGSLAMTSTDASPTLRYFPVVNFAPQIGRGIRIPRLVNNTAYAANLLQGKAAARCTINSFLFLNGLVNADFITRAVLNAGVDTSASGYHSLSMRPNNLGSGPENYFRAKFATLAFAASSFGDETATMSADLMSIDPEATGTALAAPSAGPLSAGKQIATFSDMSFTGASNIVSVSFAFDAGLDTEGGSAAGSNAKYPKVPAGLLQTDLTGTLTLTQVANPATVLCGSSIQDTLTIDVGTSANGGFGLVLKVAPIGENKPVSVGTRYEQRTYQLFGGDGTSPVTIADLT